MGDRIIILTEKQKEEFLESLKSDNGVNFEKLRPLKMERDGTSFINKESEHHSIKRALERVAKENG